MVWQSSVSKDDAVMLWAAVACAFFFVVGCDDVGMPHYLEVRMKAFKTDPFFKGVSVYLSHTDTDLCPVDVILGYKVLWGSQQGLVMFQDDSFLT